MCGIISFVWKRDDVGGGCDLEGVANELIVRETMNSLRELLNRGYDSIGLGLVGGGVINVERTCVLNEDMIDELIARLLRRAGSISARCCIGHTRWATHGGRNERNAHPHISMGGIFALVHNGIVENYESLKRELVLKGYIFNSDTDSEVIVNMIECAYLRVREGGDGESNSRMDVIRSIEGVIDILLGTFGLAIVCRDTPDDIFVVKSGSPILLGENDSCIMASSEVSGFRGEINYYISLQSKKVAILSARDGILLEGDRTLEEMSDRFYLAGGSNIMSKVSKNGISNGIYDIYSVVGLKEDSKPYPYGHWMLKEIMEQPETIMRVINNGARIFGDRIHLGGLSDYRDKLKKITDVILLGCGTSLHVCECARFYFLLIGRINTVSVYDAAAFTIADIPIGSGVNEERHILICMCSQSGETMDLLRCIELLRMNRNLCNFIMLGVVNVVDSQIARDVDCGVYLNAGREVSVASTKSYSASLIVFYMISIWLNSLFVNEHLCLQNKESSFGTLLSFESDGAREIRHLVVQMKQLVTQNGRECVDKDGGFKNLAETIYNRYNLVALDRPSLFILGRGRMASVARESALKFKEVCYIHAEGCHAGSLKHGPFALLCDNFPVILLIDRENRDKMMNTYEELISRGSYVFIVTNCVFDEFSYDKVVYLPYNACLSEVLFANFMHTISYAIAVKRGVNPDRPRNLAKVVTVE